MTQFEENGSITVEIVVGAGQPSQRLDTFLAASPEAELTRNRAQKLIEAGLVLVNGEQVVKKYQLRQGDTILVTIPPPEQSELVAEDIPLDIVYEDDHLAVVNKPAGMVTHPGAGNFTGTLVNAMLHHFQTLASGSAPDRPGIVHRLDKNTSGLLVVARDEPTYLKLQAAIQARKVTRAYLVLLCGHLAVDSGTIDQPIGRSRKDRKKMAVTNVASRAAVTDYRLLKRYRSYDLVEASLRTGRTHQIRVHFAHGGHPGFGDPEYGGRESWHRGMYAPERPLAKKLLATLDRQALHAQKLEFVHPITGRNLKLTAELPADLQNLLDILDKEGA